MPSPRPAATWFDALLILGVLILAVLLIGPALAIGRRIPLNYNEGWNAYWAVRAIDPAAGPLYPPAGSLVFNNYPPLSFYLVGAIGKYLAGDMIVAGRAVALASMLACGALLLLAVRRLGGSSRASVAAGLLMLVFACTFFREYEAMDDPQWLGHAVMLAGLVVLLGKPALPPPRVAAAALLILLGGLVKHNLVALPLAVTLWLGLAHRRAALVWIATGAAGAGLAAAAAWAFYGPAALHDILNHARTLQPGGVLKGAGRLLPLAPMALLAGLLLYRQRQLAPVRVASVHLAPMRLAVAFVLIACLTGLAQRAGAGVAINAQFETLIAVCLAAGLALDHAGSRRFTALAVMALPILIVLPRRLPNAWADLTQAQARAQAWRPMITRLASTPDPVACETLALCYWAGQPFTVDLFNLTQSVLARGSNERFTQMAAQRAFNAVEVTPRSPVHQGRDPLMDQLAGYVPALSGPQGSVLLVRR